MPRGPRLDGQGALHHVMARGIERRQIFNDDVDRAEFVRRLDELCAHSNTALYAWCLLPNHFHLLVRTGDVPLSTIMRCLLTGHAVRYNRRHGRVGHLLQNRFKSILVEEDPYFLELVRYIHLNAVRAGLVADSDDLAGYRWAGHGALLGQPALRAHDTEFVLRLFDRRLADARDAYRHFVAEGVPHGRRTDLTGGGVRRSRRRWVDTTALTRGREQWAADERVLGSAEFVARTLRERPTPLLQAARGEAMAPLLDLVAARCGIDASEIRSSSHRPLAVRARAVVCFVAIVRHGFTASSVAAYLGISRRSVARALQHAQPLAHGSGLADLMR